MELLEVLKNQTHNVVYCIFTLIPFIFFSVFLLQKGRRILAGIFFFPTSIIIAKICSLLDLPYIKSILGISFVYFLIYSILIYRAIKAREKTIKSRKKRKSKKRKNKVLNSTKKKKIKRHSQTYNKEKTIRTRKHKHDLKKIS